MKEYTHPTLKEVLLLKEDIMVNSLIIDVDDTGVEDVDEGDLPPAP